MQKFTPINRPTSIKESYKNELWTNVFLLFFIFVAKKFKTVRSSQRTEKDSFTFETFEVQVNHFVLQSISPGVVRTEMFDAGVYEAMMQLLSVDDVVKAIIFILDTSPNVLVSIELYHRNINVR